MRKVLPLLMMVLTLSSSMTALQNNYSVEVAMLSIQLPNLTFKLGDFTIPLNNGQFSASSGGIRSATLHDRVLFSDFNNDGHPDAAVLLHVVYDGIGYFSNVVFVVFQDYVKGAIVSNGIHASIATYKIDVFSVDPEGKKIIVGFMDRLPGQPKAAAPSVPTYMFLQVKNNTLETAEVKTVSKDNYPF